MTQPIPFAFLALPAFPNWRSSAAQPDSDAVQPVAFRKLAPFMTARSDLIRQREITRIVKGAKAAGFQVTALKIDKDGSIVLFSNSSEREEPKAPRLPIGSNEWDEVLKK